MDNEITSAEMSMHSTLKLWMMENRAKFAEDLRAAGKPSWTKIAKRFNAMGLRNADGELITPATAKLTWWRIEHPYAPKVTRYNEAKQPATSHQPSVSSAMDRLKQKLYNGKRN